MRDATLGLLLVLLSTPTAAQSRPSLIETALNTDGPWVTAARTAASEHIGVDVTVSSSGGAGGCETPGELLTAEAESILRRDGFNVQDGALNDTQVSIRVVALDSSPRCILAFSMELSFEQVMNFPDDPYFGEVVVDGTMMVLAHPAEVHRDVLRRAVNEQVTIWSNRLARHSQPLPQQQ